MDSESLGSGDTLGGRDSKCSLGSSTTASRRTPTTQTSAKFQRTSSALSQQEDKAAVALRKLLTERLLITQPGDDDEDDGVDGDDDLDDEFITRSEPCSRAGQYSRMDGLFSRGDGRYSRDTDYETDLEMDYDEWIAEENNVVDEKSSQEKKYIFQCNEEGTIPVSYFLRHVEDQKFRMRHHGLGPLGAKAICMPLKDNSRIETLDLEGNWVEGDGAIHLSEMLKENMYLTEVNLAENHIGREGGGALCDMLHKNDILLSLNISGNQLGDVGAEKICQMLQKNTTLKRLHVSHNEFEEKAAFHFKEALSHNESLETLDLSWNHFRTQGAVAIAEGVQENYGLKSLNLSMNGFGGMGAEALGRALKHNRGLTELDVSHNRIPEEGAGHIALGLQTNDILKILKIGYNPLGSEGPTALLVSIFKNDMSNVNILDLSDVFVMKDFKELQQQMEKDRIFTVTYAGVLMERQTFDTIVGDPKETFRRDPYGKLRTYIEDSGYRLIDLFKDFDKDGSMTLTKDEFILGLKNAGVQITMNEINVLLQNLDTNKDGMVDYGELITGDRKFRLKTRKHPEGEEEERQLQEGLNRFGQRKSEVIKSILS